LKFKFKKEAGREVNAVPIKPSREVIKLHTGKDENHSLASVFDTRFYSSLQDLVSRHLRNLWN